MGRYGRLYDPEEWVDEAINEFGHSPSTVNEMLASMKGSKVPDSWIVEALVRSVYHQNSRRVAV